MAVSMNISLSDLNLEIPASVVKSVDEAIEEYSKEIINKGFNRTNLQNILNTLKQWKIDYETVKKMLKNALTVNEVTANKYKKNIDSKNLTQARIDVLIRTYENQLKKGYALLQSFREALSNEETEYRILVDIDDTKMTERKFSMKEMLDGVSFSSTALINQLTNETNKIEELQAKIKKENVLDKGTEITFKSSALYNSLIDFYSHNHRLNSPRFLKRTVNGKNEWVQSKLNRGRIYEIFYQLIESGAATENTIINNYKTDYYDLLTEYFFAVRSENIKFFQHTGDVGNKELKNISHSNSNATLFSSNTIINNISKLITILDNFLSSGFENYLETSQELKKIFTSNQKQADPAYNQKIERAIMKGLLY